MNKAPRLKQGLAIAMLTLVLSGSSLGLWAQQEQQEPVKVAPPEQQEKQDAKKAPVTTSRGTDAAESPFDYQSSEKISEDLSVSFPVDI